MICIRFSFVITIHARIAMSPISASAPRIPKKTLYPVSELFQWSRHMPPMIGMKNSALYPIGVMIAVAVPVISSG